jgi:hypothetical protein
MPPRQSRLANSCAHWAPEPIDCAVPHTPLAQLPPLSPESPFDEASGAPDGTVDPPQAQAAAAITRPAT